MYETYSIKQYEKNLFFKQRSKKFIKRYYYWSHMRLIIKRYIRNCQRSKIFKNKKNDFLMFLIISKQRWIDIVMNFIIDLFKFYDQNVICIIINRLIKKRHYVLCVIEKESIFVETCNLMNVSNARIIIIYNFRSKLSIRNFDLTIFL